MSEQVVPNQVENMTIFQPGIMSEIRGSPTHTASYRYTEPATIVFRPIEGKFWKDRLTSKIDPYCKFKIGWHRAKSSVANEVGDHSFWHEAIAIERKHGERFAKLKCKNRYSVLKDNLGSCKIDLDEIAREKKARQWFHLMKGDKIMGEILVDIEYNEHPKPSAAVP